MNPKVMAMICQVSLGTVNNILKCCKWNGTIEPKRIGKSGPSRKATDRDEFIMIRKSLVDKVWSAKRFGKIWSLCTWFYCNSKIFLFLPQS